MDLYILDDLNRRDIIIDTFISLIWTERYTAWGDFELHIFSDNKSKSLLKLGSRLVIDDSERVMTIETISDDVDAEGRKILVLKGRSLEAILEDRYAGPTPAEMISGTDRWVFSGDVVPSMRTLYWRTCVQGIPYSRDVLPDVIYETVNQTGRIPEPDIRIQNDIAPSTVYAEIKKIAEAYDVGFRLIRHRQNNTLHFHVYMGYDRTTFQTVNSPVVFAPNLDNLQNTSHLTTNALFKNVAYVFSSYGHEGVYGTNVNTAVEGWERRALVVTPDDPPDGLTSEQITDYLVQKGREALAGHRIFSAFDGEIQQNSQYKYGVDYGLGDLVEMRSDDGVVNQMLVTEHIWASDAEGDRSYPTVTLYEFVQPGSWKAWDQNKEWATMTTETWATMP